jgi:L-histidine Nalpha-methyltransferase
MKADAKTHETRVAAAARKGLTAKNKNLPSWMFYDASGTALFNEITNLPEYYLRKSEMEILARFSDAIAYNFRSFAKEWDIIEFEAGDVSKTTIFVNAFTNNGIRLIYHAVNISEHASNNLKESCAARLSDVHVVTHEMDYLAALRSIPVENKRRRLILFLGAGIGNFELHDAGVFLKSVSSLLRPDDRLLISFDLMKSPAVIEKAYYDYKGVTSLFHKNLLTRLNKEVDADFNLTEFEHWSLYDVVSGACRCYLVSVKKHEVNLKRLNLKVSFNPWETISTQLSQKYNEDMIFELAGVSNLTVERMIYDDRRYFSFVFFKGRNSN